MTGKHQKTLHAIFADPVRSNINWTEIEALLIALGAERSEGSGSRIRFILNGIRYISSAPPPERGRQGGREGRPPFS